MEKTMNNNFLIDGSKYQNAFIKHLLQNAFLFIILLFVALWNGLFKNGTFIPTIVLLTISIVWFAFNIYRIYGNRFIEVVEDENSILVISYKSFLRKRTFQIDKGSTINLKIPDYANEKSKTIMYATITFKSGNDTQVKFKMLIQDAVEAYLFCNKRLDFLIRKETINKIKRLNDNMEFIHLKNINFN